MQKRMLSGIEARFVFVIVAVCFALAFLVPLSANAQVTISQVRVTISGTKGAAVYCDNTLACASPIWTLPSGGVFLDVGQTLLLTQTGLGTFGGNFDTSDRITPGGLLGSCDSADPCTVTIELDTGSGLTVVFTSAAPSALNASNKDTNGTTVFNEGSAFAVVANGTNYTLSTGYADNEHGTCLPVCIPTPWIGAVTTSVNSAAINVPQGDCTTSCFDGGALLITGKKSTSLPGRMTGGGSVFTSAGLRVTHGFELHCDIRDLPNTLEINWDGGNNFNLNTLTSAFCSDDPAIAPQPPNAPFDTFVGAGTGTLNGLPATIKFTLTDAGEPGTTDTAKYEITQNSVVVLSVGPVALEKGNHQAHK